MMGEPVAVVNEFSTDASVHEPAADMDSLCEGRVPVKAAATFIAVCNILIGISGFPIFYILLAKSTIYGYGLFAVLIAAGLILLAGIHLEKAFILSYFRTYQWLMNLCFSLTLFVMIFLQFNMQTFIAKYWPSEENTLTKLYSDEEMLRGHLVLGAYTVCVAAYLAFGLVSMYVVKRCMKYCQNVHKDGTNYATYRY